MDLLKALPIPGSAYLPWWSGRDGLLPACDVIRLLVAGLVYFWRDWRAGVPSGVYALRTRSIQDPDARLLVLPAVEKVPAAGAGFWLENPTARPFFSALCLMIALLLAVAVLFAIRSAISKRRLCPVRVLSDPNTRTLLWWAGRTPGILILPGVSRSGGTAAPGMGRLCLDSAPIMGGAGVRKTPLSSTRQAGYAVITPVVSRGAVSVVGDCKRIRFLLCLPFFFPQWYHTGWPRITPVLAPGVCQ